MNVLVSNISILHDGEPFSYEIKGLDCSVSRVDASETNESILRCVVSLNDVRKSGGLKKIIALVSNAVLNNEKVYLGEKTSAFGYFAKCASYFGISEKDIIKVPIENTDESQRSINLILDDICENISSEDTVYIDGAGGLRTINNVIQLLTKILKYAGIKNPCTLYADVQNRPNCFIYDTKNYDKMTDLADAFNEFMTSGKSEQLSRCLSEVSNKSISELVRLMCEFSDKIRLGYIDDIEDTVKKINGAAIVVEAENDSSCMESVIIRRFIPVIRKKLIGNNEKTDYCRLVEWCLENSLIQQAVTIFTEKIPIYLFDNNILALNNKEFLLNYENEMKNPSKSVHWQTTAVYTNILTVSKTNQIYEEFKNCLKNNAQSKNESINQVVQAINSFQPTDPVWSEINCFYIEKKYSSTKKMINALINTEPQKCLSLLGIKSQNKGKLETKMLDEFRFCLRTSSKSSNTKINSLVEKILTFIPSQTNMQSDSLLAEIQSFFKTKKYTSKDSLINALCNTEKAECFKLLGIEEEESKKDKFFSVDFIEKNNRLNTSDFSYNVSTKDIVEILYGYLYVKNIRNRINHASDAEMFTDEQKTKLKNYDFTAFDLKTVKKNIFTALNSIKKVKK